MDVQGIVPLAIIVHAKGMVCHTLIVVSVAKDVTTPTTTTWKKAKRAKTMTTMANESIDRR